MSDAHGATADAHQPDHHGSAAHGDAHDGHDDHHDGMALGGIAWGMWLAGLAGLALGLVVVAGFLFATQGTQAY